MKTTSLLLALAAFASSASMSHAALVYGLTSNNRLVSFDSATPGTILSNVAITGATGFVDIDIYAVNGSIYGLLADGSGYTITPGGVATQVITPNTSDIVVRDFDFNPSADRIRISGTRPSTTDPDFNFRMVPNITTNNPGTSGAVLFDGTYTGDIPVSTLNIVGNAYTNNFDGTSATTLYSLDTGSDRLLVHPAGGAPTFNTFTSIALTGATLGSNVGFDIDQGTNAFVSDDNLFYTLDLATGALTSIGTIGGGNPIISIAVVPEPSRALLSLAGLMLIGLRRRRR
jgi:hypothetical protein